MTYPIEVYPTTGGSNSEMLFATLGEFWTQVFNDRATLKGLATVNSEETFQAYYTLIDAISTWSSRDINIFRTIKWLPIIIKKSQLNTAAFRFSPDITFGDIINYQPYVFGKPAPQDANVFSVSAPAELAEFTVVTNRIISPSFVLINNQDIKLENGFLYFYGNPFDLPNISKTSLVNNDGSPLYYQVNGINIQDEELVLWCYNAKIDKNDLALNIGYLFGANLSSSIMNKNILDATVKLFSRGPTIAQIKAICAAFINIPVVSSDNEVVENIQDQSNTPIIITTNKNVYRFDRYYSVNPTINIGSLVQHGDILVNAVEFYDNVSYKNWWLNKMVPRINDGPILSKSPSFTVPPFLFAGNYEFGLTFSNSMELVTVDTNGRINFPVSGTIGDVAKFQDSINQNVTNFLSVLGNPTSSQPTLINPMDFLFQYVFKYNTAMIKINFKTEEQLKFFTQYFGIIKGCLPKHVFFVFFFDITIQNNYYTSAGILDASGNEQFISPVTTSTAMHANSIGEGYLGEYLFASGSDNDTILTSATTVATYSVLPGQSPLIVFTPILPANESVSCNVAPTNGICIKECILSKSIPNNITTVDYNSLYLKKVEN